MRWIKLLKPFVTHLLLGGIGVFMVYPLLWMIAASFKDSNEIFTSLSLIPTQFSFDAYIKGWQGIGQTHFGLFFRNTLMMVLPTVLFTVVSSVLVAYGFVRFRFPLKNFLFALMLSMLMLPEAVIIIPRYILFNRLGWLDSYLPFIVPAIFSTNSFFIFMLVQFFRGLPKDLYEASEIDGCNSFTTLTRIILPLTTPALFSVAIFQFIWLWNDFFNSIIYINSVTKFTLALGLNMALDNSSVIHWNQLMAMSVVTIIPPILVFFFAQKHFVEGITTTGLKG